MRDSLEKDKLPPQQIFLHNILELVCKSAEVDGETYFEPKSEHFQVSLAGTVARIIHHDEYYMRNKLMMATQM